LAVFSKNNCYLKQENTNRFPQKNRYNWNVLRFRNAIIVNCRLNKIDRWIEMAYEKGVSAPTCSTKQLKKNTYHMPSHGTRKTLHA